MTRKLLSIVICVLLLVGLTACVGDTEEPQNTEPVVTDKEPETTAKPTTDEEKDDGSTDKTDATTSAEPKQTTAPEITKPEPDPEPDTQPATREAAQAYIGSSAAAMAAAIGQPNGKNYSTGCNGEGEDGEWYYSDFTVYTYRDANGEQVVGVR